MAEVPLSEDDVLSAEETARLLDMDILKVRRLALQGRIPAYRIPGGRKYKFFRSEVDAYAIAVAEEAKARAAADAAASDPDGAPGDAPEGVPVAVPVASDAAVSAPDGAPGDVLADAPVAGPATEETVG